MPVDPMIRHWLLNLAVEYPVWLGHLFPAVDCEALNVRPVPGCDAPDYARTLIEACDAGMVTLSSEVPGDDVSSRVGIERIVARFLASANNESTHIDQRHRRPMCERVRLPGMEVRFKLTEPGGDAWARLAEPDWAHILTVSLDLASGDLFSPDRQLLMAYMGWYQQIEGQQIPLEAITWQTHSDFQILYWKRLPLVYQATFTSLPAESRIAPRWSSAPLWFTNWYISAITWHKQPWELRGWL